MTTPLFFHTSETARFLLVPMPTTLLLVGGGGTTVVRVTISSSAGKRAIQASGHSDFGKTTSNQCKWSANQKNKPPIRPSGSGGKDENCQGPAVHCRRTSMKSCARPENAALLLSPTPISIVYCTTKVSRGGSLSCPALSAR